jgi:hypothetical protein
LRMPLTVIQCVLNCGELTDVEPPQPDVSDSPRMGSNPTSQAHGIFAERG